MYPVLGVSIVPLRAMIVLNLVVKERFIRLLGSFIISN